jgi:hypothetical protein
MQCGEAMILTRLIKNVFRPELAVDSDEAEQIRVARLLNVGGGNKGIPIPAEYSGWEHVLLDIAPGPDVDLVLDARGLASIEAEQFDGIYCSHNLEHYFRHDGARVLAGFVHVLRSDGYAYIRVPDMSSLFRKMVSEDLDIDDTVYTPDSIPISFHDIVYGWGRQIESSGVDFYAHKSGYTAKALKSALEQAGFGTVYVAAFEADFELKALAFKTQPTEAQRAALGL